MKIFVCAIFTVLIFHRVHRPLFSKETESFLPSDLTLVFAFNAFIYACLRMKMQASRLRLSVVSKQSVTQMSVFLILFYAKLSWLFFLWRHKAFMIFDFFSIFVFYPFLLSRRSCTLKPQDGNYSVIFSNWRLFSDDCHLQRHQISIFGSEINQQIRLATFSTLKFHMPLA